MRLILQLHRGGQVERPAALCQVDYYSWSSLHTTSKWDYSNTVQVRVRMFNDS